MSCPDSCAHFAAAADPCATHRAHADLIVPERASCGNIEVQDQALYKALPRVRSVAVGQGGWEEGNGKCEWEGVCCLDVVGWDPKKQRLRLADATGKKFWHSSACALAFEAS